MIKITDKKNCSGCKACYNICPRNCIYMISDGEGFWYPEANEERCVSCGLCENVCPEINIYKNGRAGDVPTCIAAWNLDKGARENSSSGGVFTSIAAWILKNDGVVFGAAYDVEHNVIHNEAHTIEALSELRGSKYVQSDINNTYNRAKKHLKTGKRVLFTGTPCQIAGLYNFLRKDYAELYTCDIVCHGVPSPIVFQKYKKNLEQSYNSNISEITFRNKKHGWKSYCVAMQFENGSEYSKTFINDVYMKGFLRNYYLRPSCYKCSYAKLPRISDITLGDFWGIASKYPELDDDGGTSLLLINTNKGKAMLEGCKNGIEKHKCDLEHALRGNPSIISSVKQPQKRKSFFEDLHNRDFNYVIKKYMSPPTYMERVIIFGVRVLRLLKKRVRMLIKR
ncbi:Coenzyme F420 hydrogenase/dehydrogenase, beta subunit C-terminal domain [Clostridium sp. CF012]|uniref:Coenzyme F420 hydrogenase/dehydrogenase, beta subunit C-terminal domain n=1 Tax=Clostridium sp. CF012 TaxID=2843319 RepID=UPI001C0B51EA|nr:Coenzyme F420 hydrogenase/dehydrogenase, beta subunit C-terminal domain [Clostridium sp. CF012]MBU3142614.1 Coenzyme F420 hydrogenase/dehydrogenase, beta subunit C-terminal domain [Clostridium sp. CF012]